MALLYYHAENDHLVVAGTTNKSEYMQGYFVKYGDGGSDIEPLVNLYKSQIYQLGKFLNVPNEVISKDASPDVWSYTTNDEEFFYSVPYKIVDLILYGRENNLSINEIQKHSKISIENKNLETVQKELEIKKNEEFSRYQQEREIAIQKANERTETIRQKAEKEREAEEAEIQSQEAIEVAKISQNQVIEVERKLTETRLIEEIEKCSRL